MKNITAVAQLILLVMVFVYSASAAGEVDTSFAASLTNDARPGVRETVVQPDGKILIAGNFRLINQTVHHGIARLNADGTLDTTFNSPDLYLPSDAFPTVNSIALQSTGKILVGGVFYVLGAQTRYWLIRLNPDGTLDNTFPHVFDFAPQAEILKISVYPDDRFLVGARFNSPSPVTNNIRRFLPDGTPDGSFNYNGDRLTAFTLQPDGKILVSTRTSGVRRYNDNGSLDPTFAQIALGDFGGNPTDASEMEYLPDGKILIGGYFGKVNNVDKRGLFRANADGTVDTTYPNTQLLFGGVNVITRDSNGKIYVGGQFSQIWGSTAHANIARLNADGTLDTDFDYVATGFTRVLDIDVLTNGNVLVSGDTKIAQVNSIGIENPNFRVDIFGTPAKGFKVLVQPDNKILVAGDFNMANGTPRVNLARFNADGTLDTGFTPASVPGREIIGLALLPDGKILVAGSGGVARRLNANGTLDVIFEGTTNQVFNFWDVVRLPNGKILFAGPDLRRFNADDTSDGILATIGNGSLFPLIHKMAVQPDGKIIIVGNFLNVNEQGRNRIARFNADGTLDNTFNPPGANDVVSTVALQPDGKILIGGSFTSFNSDASKKYIARLNPDGSLDPGFSTEVNAPVIAFKIQTDGKIIIGGSMSVVNGVARAGIARLNPNGSLDASFSTGTGTNSTVWSVDQQTDGKVIYAGQFFRTNGISTIGIGRLLNSTIPARRLFDYDGDGKADISVFRPSENKWYVLRSSDGQVTQQVFAINGDVPVPADFDGDGKTDFAIYRPSSGDWWYLSSLSGSQLAAPWGNGSTAITRPSDFDGDGKADFIFFNSPNLLWYRVSSASGSISNVMFGLASDKPVTGDFDGDGKSDVAIYRPSTGDWWWRSSIDGGQRATHWGISTDLPAPADYDGDGKTDFAVYRPSNGTWYIYNSATNSSTILNFGLAEDKPVPADYDGDGKADIAVFRPSTGVWYLMRSSQGFAAAQFGISSDIPTPNAFVP